MTAEDPGAADGGAVPEHAVSQESLLVAMTGEWAEEFPWVAGLLTGIGAFVLGYAILAVLVLVGPLSLPGAGADLLVWVGFLLYNSHNVAVVAHSAGPSGFALDVQLLSQASIPVLYRLFPAVILAAGSAGYTYWREPTARSVRDAAATAAAMATGYVLIAIAGTFAFGLEQGNVLYKPEIGGTVLFALAYGLAGGFVGSLFAQAALVDE